jgi:hypothetical protein
VVADAGQRKRSKSRSGNAWRKGAVPAPSRPPTAERRRHSSPAMPSSGQAVAPAGAGSSAAPGQGAAERPERGMVDLDAVLDPANLHFVEQHNKVAPRPVPLPQQGGSPVAACAARPVADHCTAKRDVQGCEPRGM